MQVRKLVAVGLAGFAALAVGGCEGCPLILSHSVEANPQSATVGEDVTFTPSYRLVDRAGLSVSAWDLDGDGQVETYRDPEEHGLPVTRAYDQPATLRISHLVRVHSLAAALHLIDVSVAHVDIAITAPGAENQPPFATFTVAPQPVDQERPVTFDASGSSDSDGSVVRYQWDLDGNGTFEIDSGANPVHVKQDGYIANQRVVLRLTDDDGQTAEAERTVIVQEPPPLPRDGALRTRLASAGKPFSLVPVGGRLVKPGKAYINGDQLLLTGVKATGKLPAAPFPRELRRGNRKVQVAAALDVSVDTVAQTGSSTGFALLTFPKGGRACSAFETRMSLSGKPDGTFDVLGGQGGDADRLRGSGTAEARLDADGLVVEGRADLRLRAARKFKLAKSGCGPLRKFG